MLCLCTCPYVCVGVSLCVPVCLRVSLCVYVSVSACMSLCVCWCLCICLCVCACMSACVSVCVSVSASHTRGSLDAPRWPQEQKLCFQPLRFGFRMGVRKAGNRPAESCLCAGGRCRVSMRLAPFWCPCGLTSLCSESRRGAVAALPSCPLGAWSSDRQARAWGLVVVLCLREQA